MTRIFALLFCLGVACSHADEHLKLRLDDFTASLDPESGTDVETILGEDPLIALVFSPRDCAVALQAIDQLNVLYGEGIPVAGILNTPYRKSAVKTIRAYDIRFPVLYDSLGGVRIELGAEHWPVLLQVRRGTVDLVAEVGTKDAETYRKIMESSMALRQHDP